MSTKRLLANINYKWIFPLFQNEMVASQLKTSYFIKMAMILVVCESVLNVPPSRFFLDEFYDESCKTICQTGAAIECFMFAT